jgi:hypothetical protein
MLDIETIAPLFLPIRGGEKREYFSMERKDSLPHEPYLAIGQAGMGWLNVPIV